MDYTAAHTYCLYAAPRVVNLKSLGGYYEGNCLRND